MKFGDIPLTEAEGAILAHSVREASLVFKKGRRLSAEDVAGLKAAGRRTVVAAVLEDGDVHEDAAAGRLAAAVTGENLTASAPFTGRVNLFADARGLAVVDRERLDRINRMDESITIATLPQYAPVEPGQMVATIKIIPFAAPDSDLQLSEAVAQTDGTAGVVRVAPFRPRKVGLVQTRLPGTKPKVLDKTSQVTAARLEPMGMAIARDRRCGHVGRTLAGEIRSMLSEGVELVLMVGASAITDRRDVLPEAIELAGGAVEHFGMPVDPGNLLLLGAVDGVPVLGLPGCARSPKLNGFDWVLQRLAADVPVSRADIMAMGVGGLLTEIPSRPLPRAQAAQGSPAVETPRAPRIAAIVLSAGQSRRMGARNKLLAEIDGMPMVLRAVDAALASQAGPVIVVTGHEREAVEAALAGREVVFAHNPEFAEGISTSLNAGLDAVPDTADGAVICLGDMPLVSSVLLDRLIAAYNPTEGRAIVVPTQGGKRGNPVLWDRRFFAEMHQVAGDVGARHLIGDYAELVAEVETGDAAVLTDIDTPDALDSIAGGAS